MSTKYKVKDNAKLFFIARTIVGLQVRRKNKHGLQVRANGTSPTIEFVDEPTFPFAGGNGSWTPELNKIQLNKEQAKSIEKLLGSDASDEEKLEGFLHFYKTLLHETAHKGNTNENFERIVKEGEAGREFDNAVWGSENFDSYFEDTWKDEGVAKGIIEKSKKTEEGQKTLPTIPTKEE